MMRIEAVWLALGASDLRGGIDALLAAVVRGHAGGVQPHHAYAFANRRAHRLKVLLYDGVGMWLCTRRLQTVAVLHHVVLALGAHFSGFLRPLFALAGDEVFIGNRLGADEATLEFSAPDAGDRHQWWI